MQSRRRLKSAVRSALAIGMIEQTGGKRRQGPPNRTVMKNPGWTSSRSKIRSSESRVSGTGFPLDPP
jgi:hypothetical protein